jgi:hypothetical protein
MHPLYRAPARRLGLWSAACYTLPLKRTRVCDRKTERNVFSQQRPFTLPHSPPRRATLITARRLVSCVTSERERERYSERHEVVWVVAPCGWVIPFWRFERTCPFHFLGYESVSWLIILKVKAVTFLRNICKKLPTTRRNNSQDLVPQNHSVETSDHSFYVVKNIFISVTLCPSLIVSCWYRIYVLQKSETLQVFITFGRQSPEYMTKGNDSIVQH